MFFNQLINRLDFDDDFVVADEIWFVSLLQDVTFGEYQLCWVKDGLANRDEIIDENRRRLAEKAAELPDNPNIRPPVNGG